MSNAIPGAGRRMITKRQLKLRTFIGLQELSEADPGDRLVTILEERELAHRFGVEYEEYRSRVPAIFPKLRQRR